MDLNTLKVVLMASHGIQALCLAFDLIKKKRIGWVQIPSLSFNLIGSAAYFLIYIATAGASLKSHLNTNLPNQSSFEIFLITAFTSFSVSCIAMVLKHEHKLKKPLLVTCIFFNSLIAYYLA